MSTLGLFWICSVVIAYGVGMGIGIYLYKPKKTKKNLDQLKSPEHSRMPKESKGESINGRRRQN